jgi:drug/metabolite transporter (DMT)-like permease
LKKRNAPAGKIHVHAQRLEYAHRSGICLDDLDLGSFSIAVKIGVVSIPPFLLASTRFFLAAVLLFAFIAIRRERLLLPRRRLPGIALLSTLIIGIPSGCFFWAAQYGAAGTLSTIWATSPIFTAVISRGAKGEARGWRVGLSLAIGLLGVALVFIEGRVKPRALAPEI